MRTTDSAKTKILSGISLAVLIDLAETLGFTCRERDLTPDDLSTADEILLCSTSLCTLPVLRFNQQPVGDGRVGNTYQQIIAGWGKLVGLDIRAQAARFKERAL